MCLLIEARLPSHAWHLKRGKEQSQGPSPADGCQRNPDEFYPVLWAAKGTQTETRLEQGVKGAGRPMENGLSGKRCSGAYVGRDVDLYAGVLLFIEARLRSHAWQMSIAVVEMEGKKNRVRAHHGQIAANEAQRGRGQSGTVGSEENRDGN